MGDHVAVLPSTQERNPRSAVLRTVLAAVVALFPLLNLALVVTIEVLEPYHVNLPGWVFLWLNGALAVVTVITALVTRILAIPGVNDWLRRYAPIFAPEDNGIPEPNGLQLKINIKDTSDPDAVAQKVLEQLNHGLDK